MGVVKTGLALALVGVLAGCSKGGVQPAAGDEGAAAASTGRCDAQAAQFAVGQQASKALLEEAKARSGSMMARILGPHDAVTLDYRSERLNLNADETGKVIRANCG
jgi:Peptidase inhibitor I78 family